MLYKVNSDGTTSRLVSYSYDDYNQLVTVNDEVVNTYTSYTYDESGNITRELVQNLHPSYGYPVSVQSDVSYTYGDSQWKDLLTAYNGQTITYDAIGNPLTYRDGITMTWQNGRELVSYSDASSSVTYTYDASGMRTGKSVTSSTFGSAAYSYVYENGLLLQMRRGNRILDFSYDANGTPVSFAYRSNASSAPIYYYYGVNSRGDVVALYNSTGTFSARYEYDAYGKCLGVTSPAGAEITNEYAVPNLNPLRYRGYVYDRETGLYYLQSRYYDPTTCRFVNEDGYVSTGQAITGNNMFAYCNNNPVMFSDESGYNAEALDWWAKTMLWLCAIDSALPVGDIIYVSGWLVLGGIAICSSPSNTTSNVSEKEVDIPSQPKNEEIPVKFPENPCDFNPSGLILKKHVEIGNGKNGGIYKWVIPLTKIAIFEWNEDYENGPHYHVMKIEWDNKHLDPTHYHAGDNVPEPWKSIYFGG